MTNPWGPLTPVECQQNEGQFLLLQPYNNLINGEQARPFFLKSGLNPNLLAQVYFIYFLKLNFSNRFGNFRI